MTLPASKWETALILIICAIPLSGCFQGSPVLNAAEEGNLQKLQSLLKEGKSINERDPKVKFGWTPLIAAIYQDKTNVAHYLIASGADVNIPDNRGETAIIYAMVDDENIDIVKDLIAHGADLNAAVLSCASSAPPKPKVLEVIKEAMTQREKRK